MQPGHDEAREPSRYAARNDRSHANAFEDDAIGEARCLRCYFDLLEAIERNRDDYERAYGHVPEFRAGLHAGRVIAGELGELKQEIVYVGDTLNVGARLEEHAKREGRGLVVSDELLARLTLPSDMLAESLGVIEVRGRAEDISVSEVVRRQLSELSEPSARA